MEQGPALGYVVIAALCLAGGGSVAYAVFSPAPKTEASTPNPLPDDPAKVAPKATARQPSPAPDPDPANAAPLGIQDIVVGKGAEALEGDKVSVHYVGVLQNGEEFDSSKRRDRPFTFDLGKGQVIKGWDQGVVGMHVGGKRKLTIPPHLAYGDRGAGGKIPPKATLLFEVELLEVQQGKAR